MATSTPKPAPAPAPAPQVETEAKKTTTLKDVADARQKYRLGQFVLGEYLAVVDSLLSASDDEGEYE